MKTLTLKSPVTKGERTIRELNFQEPKVKHILCLDACADKESYGADLALTAALTGEPESLLQEMEPEDWHRVQGVLAEVYGRFMGLSSEDIKEALSPPEEAEADRGSASSRS